MINLLDKVFISYGTNNYDSSMVKPIDVNSRWGKSVNKPHGGLWASPVDSEFGWGDFCNRDAFNLKALSKHFLFKLKKGSNILIIDSADDLVHNSIYDRDAWKCILDFKKIVRNYDGIYISDNAASRLRYDIKLKGKDVYVSGLATWDVESICIWNSEVIEPLDEDAFERAGYHKYEKPLYTPDDEDYYYGFDNLSDRKSLQIDADFERYRNTNVEDSRKLFKGEHPGLLAQKHGNSKDAKLARRFNGTIKSGLKQESRNMNKNVIRLTESELYNIINEAINNIMGDDSIKGMNFMEVLSLNPSDLSDADLRYACRFLPTEVSEYTLSPEHQRKFDSFFDEVDRRVNSRSVMGESRDSNSKKKKAEMKRDFDDMDVKRAVDKASSMYFLKKKANKNIYDKYSKKDEFPF